MRDIFGKIKLTVGKTFAIIVLILLSPIFIILIPFFAFGNRKFDKEYKLFLDSNNGKKFFCYTSRKGIKEYVENTVIPLLDSDINIIFLNGKTPKSEFPEDCISRMLYRIENIGFPNIMKIVNGEVIDISLKKEFYNELNNKMETSKFIETLKLEFQVMDKK